METEYEKQRLTYQLCRLGFGFVSFALLLASATTVIALARLFLGPGHVEWIVQSAFWRWIDVPIVWGGLVGTYLLWGRWPDSGWQRRAGLLLVMSLVDAVLWFLDHGDAMGLQLSEVGHEWLRHEFGQALGWAEFALFASLASDLMAHLGVENAREAGKATRSLAATGAAVWMVVFLERTNWSAWPLQDRGISSFQSLLLWLGAEMLWAITLIQVTALSIAATRQVGAVLAEMEREADFHDLLKSPSDTDFGLLTSD